MGDRLVGARPFVFGGQGSGHVETCSVCGDAVYREKVVWGGQGVVEDEDGSRRAEVERALCPECAVRWADERWREEVERRGLGALAVAKLVAMGAPQWMVDAEAVKWGFEPGDARVW